MSEIAGIVSRTGRPVAVQDLTGMLKALAPALEHSLETAILHGGRTALGRVCFAPDRDTRTASSAPGLPFRAFWTGEIYRDDDPGEDATDHLLRLFARRGWDRFGGDLHGSFALAIAEEGPNFSVTLVTDHTASCPLFLLERSDRIYFASDLRAFFGIPSLDLEPDPDSLYSLFAQTCFFGGRTLVRGVRQLDYATAYRIEDGRVRTQPYWQFRVEPHAETSETELREDLAERVRRAVRRRTCSGRGVVLLSGGIDSRTIAGCIEPPDRMTGAAWSPFPERRRSSRGDWAIARAVAGSLGMPFHTVRHAPSRWDRVLQNSVRESTGAAGFVFENDVWDRLRRDLRAEYAIWGDECMGWGEGPLSARQALCWLQIWPGESYTEAAALVAPGRREAFLNRMREEYESVRERYAGAAPNDFVDELYFLHRLRFAINPKRRLMASHGLQARCPLLDRDVLDFVRRLPARHRVRKSLFRRVARDLHPGLAKLPRARAAEVADYVPLVRDAELRDGALSRLVADGNGWMSEFFDADAVAASIRAMCAPPRGPSAKDRLEAWLPVGAFQWLKGRLRTWVDPTPRLGAPQIALRLATVGAALRSFETPAAVWPTSAAGLEWEAA